MRRIKMSHIARSLCASRITNSILATGQCVASLSLLRLEAVSTPCSFVFGPYLSCAKASRSSYINRKESEMNLSCFTYLYENNALLLPRRLLCTCTTFMRTHYLRRMSFYLVVGSHHTNTIHAQIVPYS